MAHTILKALCCSAAAAALSGCFFGHATAEREPAPVKRAEQKKAALPRVVERRPVKASPPARARVTTPPSRPPAPVESVVVATAVPKQVPPNLPNVIQFGTDAYLPDPEFDSLLQAHAEELKAEPRRRVLLKGHGDATGGARYSLALAAKRAEMVAKALRNLGVDAGQLEILAVPDDGDADTATTRRVELIYR